ncbi:hypothetical protein H4R35_006568 [Dimargaris xerosporica]|nr:hypothetical protein H4R35_006568 [Dimargaris xerosporica]
MEIFGTPLVVTTDNARQFRSQTFTAFLQDHGIRHIFISAYHPKANLAERYVGLFKQTLLKCLHDQGRDEGWTRFVPQIVAAHAILPDPQSGIPPWTALFADLLLPADSLLVHPDDDQDAHAIAQRMHLKAQEARHRRAHKDMAKFNQFASREAYEPGQLVTVKVLPKPTNLAELDSRRQGPFLVMARHGLVYQLSQLDGTPLPKHLPGDRLMPYHPADPQALHAPSSDQVAQVTLADVSPPEQETLDAVSHQLAKLPDSRESLVSDPGPAVLSSPSFSVTSFVDYDTSSSQSDADHLLYDAPPSGASSFISDVDELPAAPTSPNDTEAPCPLSQAHLDTSELDGSLGSSLPLEGFAYQSASLESLLPSADMALPSTDSSYSDLPASHIASEHKPSGHTAAEKRPASRNPSDLSQYGWLEIFGVPLVVTTNNARQFHSQTFTGFLQDNGIHHIFILAYHPKANLAECYVGLFKQTLLKCLHNQGHDKGWTQFIPQIVAAHAILPDPQSGTPPWTALFTDLLLPADSLLVHPNDNQSAQAIA